MPDKKYPFDFSFAGSFPEPVAFQPKLRRLYLITRRIDEIKAYDENSKLIPGLTAVLKAISEGYDTPEEISAEAELNSDIVNSAVTQLINQKQIIETRAGGNEKVFAVAA